MTEYAHTTHRGASAPTAADVAWIRAFTKENPGLALSFQHWRSTNYEITLTVRDKKTGRLISRHDGTDRLSLVKEARAAAAAGTLNQGGNVKANAGGRDPAAVFIKTGRTSTPAPTRAGNASNHDTERERMLQIIRIAQAEM